MKRQDLRTLTLAGLLGIGLLLLASACASVADVEKVSTQVQNLSKELDKERDKVKDLGAELEKVKASVQPKTQNLQAEIFHIDSFARPAGVKAGLPEEKRVVTTYMWRPNGLYALKGDTVVLKIVNFAGTKVHSFELEGYGLNTGEMMPKSEKTVTFVADKVGVFKFKCGIDPDPTTVPPRCSPDHAYQYGFLTVLDR